MMAPLYWVLAAGIEQAGRRTGQTALFRIHWHKIDASTCSQTFRQRYLTEPPSAIMIATIYKEAHKNIFHLVLTTSFPVSTLLSN